MEERSHLDVGAARPLDQPLPGVGRNHDTSEPDDGPIERRQRWWEGDAGNVAQPVAVHLLYPEISLQRLVDPPQLAAADRSLQVRHAIIVADALVPVGGSGRHAVVAQLLDRLGK